MAIERWNPESPDGAAPVAGQPGMFRYVEWLKAGLLEKNTEIAALKQTVSRMEKRLKALEDKA